MPTNLESSFMRKDDDELLAIAHSEDYRPEAQRLAKAVLLRRRSPPGKVEEWRDPTAEFTAKPWAYGKSASALRQMSKRRRFVTRLIFWLFITLSSFGIYKARRTLDLGGAFFLIFWCLPLWYLCFIRPLLHSILFWRTPLQILLLRPVEFPKSQQRTRRFAREYLRYLGHTYTLSDPEVKPRPLFLESVQVVLVLSSLWLYRAFRPYYKVKTD